MVILKKINKHFRLFESGTTSLVLEKFAKSKSKNRFPNAWMKSIEGRNSNGPLNLTEEFLFHLSQIENSPLLDLPFSFHRLFGTTNIDRATICFRCWDSLRGSSDICRGLPLNFIQRAAINSNIILLQYLQYP